MDYQKAIETVQDIHDVAETRIKSGDARGVIYIPPDKLEDVKTAISALQELREYKENEKRNLPRTNRLMDECTYRHENGNCLKIGGFCTSVPTSHCQRYKELHNEYTEYKKLGTLEEVREAVEKQHPKKPILKNGKSGMFVDYADGHGEYKVTKWQDWCCPACGWFVGQRYNASQSRSHDQRKSNYCNECGQKIDWSEEDD